MYKTILAVAIGILIISGAVFFVAESGMKEGDLFGETEEEYEKDNEEEVFVKTEEDEDIDEREVEEFTEDEEDELSEVEKEEEKDIEDLVSCLKEGELVIYGLKTCPACAQLVASFGGEEFVESIYIECMEDREKCEEEKTTGYVPEIRIKGELYQGSRDLSSLAKATDCEY